MTINPFSHKSGSGPYILLANLVPFEPAIEENIHDFNIYLSQLEEWDDYIELSDRLTIIGNSLQNKWSNRLYKKYCDVQFERNMAMQDLKNRIWDWIGDYEDRQKANDKDNVR